MSKTILILMVAFPKADFFISCERSALIQVNIHLLSLTTAFLTNFILKSQFLYFDWLLFVQEWVQSIKSNTITQIACNHQNMALSLWSIWGWWPHVYLTMTVMISCSKILFGEWLLVEYRILQWLSWFLAQRFLCLEWWLVEYCLPHISALNVVFL